MTRISQKKSQKFRNFIIDDNTYGISQSFLADIRLWNEPRKLDLKIICTLERKIIKLFEQKKDLATLRTRDIGAKVSYTASLYIQYKQLKLNVLYNQYLETTLISQKIS